MPSPSINHKKCNLCGNCIEVCPMNCFEKQGDKIVVVNPKACIGCRACEIQCEQKAIKVLDDE